MPSKEPGITKFDYVDKTFVALLVLVFGVLTCAWWYQAGKRSADRWWQAHQEKCAVGSIKSASKQPSFAEESSLRRAFLHHQKQESPEVAAYYPRSGGEDFVMSARWKNYQKYAKECPKIAEITSVVVARTTDSGDFVISLRGPNAHHEKDGFETDVCSLWINGGTMDKELQVRDFTSY